MNHNHTPHEAGAHVLASSMTGGNMKTTDTLADIAARDEELGALCSPDCAGEDCQAERDRRTLLAELRKRDEALLELMDVTEHESRMPGIRFAVGFLSGRVKS